MTNINTFKSVYDLLKTFPTEQNCVRYLKENFSHRVADIVLDKIVQSSHKIELTGESIHKMNARR